MNIRLDETLIQGAWFMQNGQVVSDASEKRIRALIESDLKRVASTAGGWEILFRDPSDGRFWELFHPHSEMHGGGPLSLRVLDARDAASKYGSAVERCGQ